MGRTTFRVTFQPIQNGSIQHEYFDTIEAARKFRDSIKSFTPPSLFVEPNVIGQAESIFEKPKSKKRTPQEMYDYESKRIDKYTEEFQEIIEELDITQVIKDKLFNLFLWNGNARAIKSKAYQELKSHEAVKKQ